MPTIASLIVRIGAQDQDLQKSLAGIGQKVQSLDGQFKQLGNAPIGGAAQKSLEAMRATMDTITKAQQDIASRATLAAQGLEAIGGASKLTDGQLKNVSRTLQDGLSAFKALGTQAPDELKRVADAVKGQLEQPLGAIQTKVLAVGAAVGTILGNAVVQVGQQLFQAAKASFDYADSLENLKAATQFSVQGLQSLGDIGATSGVSMETLAGSVEQLQKHLDDPAAIKALHQMGLDYAAIRSLNPENQFLQIAQAVAAIQDPVERANAGAALFGRTFSAIAPAVQGDIRKVIDSTKHLSDAEVEALDAAGDAFDRFQHNSIREVESYIGKLALAAENAQLSWADILTPFNQAAQTQKLGLGAARAQDILNKELEKLPDLPSRPKSLTAAGPSVVSADADKAIRDQEAAIEKARVAAEKFKAVQDQLFGRATIDHAGEIVRALGSMDNVSKLTSDTTKKLHEELGQALAAYHALGRDVPPLLQAVFDKTAPLVIQARNIGNGMAGANLSGLPSIAGLSAEDIAKQQRLTARQTIGNVGAAAAENVRLASAAPPAQAENGKSVSDQIAASVPNAILAAIQGGGSKLQAAGSALGLTLFGRDSGITKSIAGIFSAEGVLGKTLKDAVPIIGALIGPALEGLGKLWGKVFGTAGRDAVRDFATKEGGFDTLHQKLGALGTDGEALWKSLTQGVGRNSPDQAAAAIKKVTDALDAERQKILALQGQLSTVGGRLSGITTLTPELQGALEKAFNAKYPQDYKAALDRITGELDKQKAKFDKISTTLDKYGIAFTQAGSAFKQQQINETAEGLIDDFNTLKDAGVDVKTEVHGMSDQLSKFAQDAKKAGVEVPESMRGILQTAIDAGELFDRSTQKIGANGEAVEANGDKWSDQNHKITDLSQLGLTFGTTMETVMKKTIPDAIAKLTTVLEGLATFLGITLPKAAEDGTADAQGFIDGLHGKDVDVDVHVTRKYDPDTSPDAGGFNVEGSSTGSIVRPWGLQHFAQGGIVGPPDNRLVAVGDGELIMNVAQQKNVADALNGSGPRVLQVLEEILTAVQKGVLQSVQVDGQEIVRVINRRWENGGGDRTASRQVLGVT